MSLQIRLSASRRFRLKVVSLMAATLGALLGYVVYDNASVGEPSGGESTAQVHPPISVPLPPRDIAALVASGDLVVVGTLAADVQEKLVQPYSVRNRENLPREIPPFPATDYEIDVESVLKGDANVGASSLTLRMHGHLSKQTETSARFMPRPGYHGLFVLGRHADGTYGPYFGPWSLFLIDGDTVRYADGNSTRQVEFTESLVPEAFMQAIRDEASK